jgi:hypothetical protein
MADRRDLQEELNKLNQLYQDYDLKMRKSGADDIQRQKLRDMMNAKKEKLITERGDDLQKLNIGKSINLGKTGKLIGKKVLGAVPLIGGIASALESGDASAAIPLLDEAESAGMSAEDEDMMLAEIQAKKNYANSPARMTKLKSLMKKD